MNFASILILGLVAVAAVCAFRQVRRHGTCNCGDCSCGCSGCSGCPSQRKS